MRLELSLLDGSMGKNVIIFGANMSSSVHIDNKKKDIFILGKSPKQGLNDTTLAADAQFSINFSRSNEKVCLHYNGGNSFLSVNSSKIYQFKASDLEIKKYILCV